MAQFLLRDYKNHSVALVLDKSVSAMAKLDPNSPCLDTFCDTPPNTVDDEEDHGSTCSCCENESKGESKSDTVMGGKVGTSSP